jgi:rare lipoprotein A
MSHIPKSACIQLTKLCLAATGLALLAAPVCARDLSPEFSSRVWNENETEVASVCLNGKDVVTFRAHAGSGSAADEADDLAAKLQDLVVDKNFEPSQLLPGRDGDKATLKLAGNTALSFTPLSGKKDVDNSLEASLKLVNGIRVSMGVPALPAGFPDLNTIASKGSSAFSGQASWYGPQFHGRKTSDGHRFDMDKLTAAHRSLPFGTKLLVMNRRTGDTCVVEVNDRGPFVGNRVLDLSRGAARRLNMIGSGVAMVDCLVLGTTGSN